MCVIMHKPAGVVIPDEDYTLAHSNNQDGLGLMYKDKTGRFIVEHFLDMDIDDILIRMDELDEYNVLIHFRFTTVGETVIEQCHPFEVLRKTAKRPAIHMMHNGTFDDVPLVVGENDSQAFIRHLLKPILSVDHTKLYDVEWLKWLDSMAGWSKMAFMDSRGSVSKTGHFSKRDGHIEGTEYFVSNTYSFIKDYRVPAPTPTYDRWANHYDDNVYTLGKQEDRYMPHIPETFGADQIRTMSTTELITWIRDEPNEAYNLVMAEAANEAELCAISTDTNYGTGNDIYSWVICFPEEAAELLEDWSYQ